MIYLAMLAGLVLLAPALGLLPPLRRGAAFNGLAHVAMPARSIYGPAHEAVLAQELVEFWCAWAVGLAIAAPVVWLLDTFTPLGLAGPVVAMIAWRWRMTGWGTRQLEYLGWAAEWLHGQKTAPGLYANFPGFAGQLRGGYLAFAGIAPEVVEAALRRRLPLARVILFIVAARLRRLSRQEQAA